MVADFTAAPYAGPQRCRSHAEEARKINSEVAWPVNADV
jgi:hypothetical protein